MRRRRKNKNLRRVLTLLLLAAIGVALYQGYQFLTQAGETRYDEFTVVRGDLTTYKSFSATLSTRNSETLINTEGNTIIREVYVTSGQEVKKDDNILMLGTGKVLTAGISGTVNEVRFKTGDYVWPNIRLVEISDLLHLQVQLQVDEYDVMGVQVGEKCTVNIVPNGKQYETEIAHVNRVSASNGRVAYYPVTAYLENDGTILPGMTVSVSMQDETAENALLLPVAALTYDENGNPGVLLPGGETPQWHAVSLGLSDGMQAVVTDGLQEGETVLCAAIKSEEDEVTLKSVLRRILGTREVINEERTAGAGRNRAEAEEAGSAGAPLPGMDGPKGNEDAARLQEGQGAADSSASGRENARAETGTAEENGPGTEKTDRKRRSSSDAATPEEAGPQSRGRAPQGEQRMESDSGTGTAQRQGTRQERTEK